MEASIPQLGSSDRPLRYSAAVGIGIVYAVLTALGVRYGHVRIVELHAFLPICATLWAAADLITAFLLLSQFYVAGRLAYGLIAVSYAFTGLLALPYLITFPGVFPLGAAAAGSQSSVWLWALWHCSFPLAMIVVWCCDPTLDEMTVSRPKIARVLWALVFGAAGAAALATAYVFAAQSHLPMLVDRTQHFTRYYSFYIAPTVILLNAAGYAIVFWRGRSATPLALWIGVALLTSVFDGVLNALAPGRYTLGWYIGKIEALSAASFVLAMLLYQVASLYRRLYDVASIDSLTGLHNRRSLDHDLLAFGNEQRTKTRGAALLLLDLDNFKAYNDHFGHIAGDDALRTVAAVMRASVFRPGDVVARYGGEEFAVLLRDTGLDGARAVAERIRWNVEKAVIKIGVKATHVTASIGIAYVADPTGLSTEYLLAAADRALYIAKSDGRNCVHVDGPAANLSLHYGANTGT